MDPYLTGVATSQTIIGVQENQVQACVKHFVGNEQEVQRTDSTIDGMHVEAISSNIDDRTLHEAYMWPFADAIHAGVASVMCSYNRVNQTYACENEHLINGLLKTELGFRGYVVSDWSATHSGVLSANAGLDMDMPGSIVQDDPTTSYFGTNLTYAVRNGSITESRLDDMVRRVVTPYYYLKQDEATYPTPDPSNLYVLGNSYGVDMGLSELPAGRDVRGNHSQLIRNIGSAGTVLLRNENNTLPLEKPKVIGVFGNDAADISVGLDFTAEHGTSTIPDNGFNIGTLMVGGGSGGGRASYVVSPLEAIKAQAKTLGSRVVYLMDNDRISQGSFESTYPSPDICLVFLKTYSREAVDRGSYDADWNSKTVVEKVSSKCPGKTVVITHSAGPNTMPWATNPNVTAIIAAHLPGQETGNSIVDVLWGHVNPSGKLPYTIAREEKDYNAPIVNITGSEATNSMAWQSNFEEGLMIDYRHFDSMDITPLYPFGYGLSYTTFNLLGNMSVSKIHNITQERPALLRGLAPSGGHPDLWKALLTVSTTVRNSGSKSGATVLQLYISFPSESVPPGTPIRVLRGFKKRFLQPLDQSKASFDLTRRDLSYWDVATQDWKIPSGEFNVAIGFSSRDLVQTAAVRVL